MKILKVIIIIIAVAIAAVIGFVGKIIYNVHHAKNYVALGEQLLRQNKIDEAIKIYEKAFKMNSADIVVESKLFKLYVQTKKYNKAEELTIMQLRRDPDKAQNFHRLNKLEDMYMKIGNLKRAQDVCEILIKDHGDAPSGYLRMSKVYKKRNDIKNAIRYKEQAIIVMEKDPDYARLMLNTIEKHKRELANLNKI